jgi:hypothetical protein
MRVQLLLLEQILAQYQHPVASNEALDLLDWAMCMELYGRTAMAIETASKVGVFFHCQCFAWDPGGCQCNMERVSAQWQHPEASGVALTMLHPEMESVLHRHTTIAI